MEAQPPFGNYSDTTLRSMDLVPTNTHLDDEQYVGEQLYGLTALFSWQDTYRLIKVRTVFSCPFQTTHHVVRLLGLYYCVVEFTNCIEYMWVHNIMCALLQGVLKD